MTIHVVVYANADDVLIAWEPKVWDDAWVGFSLERRDERTKALAPVNNRIPPKPGQSDLGTGGISSAVSPIRRCIWTDHGVPATKRVSYRVTAMVASRDSYAADPAGISDWTPAIAVSGTTDNGVAAYFNRGTIMSQVVSHFVQGDTSQAALHGFVSKLDDPGFPGRRYLSGDARTQILTFLADADRRGNSVYAAIYEINDHELVEALKPFGSRGHVLIGNGGATGNWVATELSKAELEMHHRDLSRSGATSPSVHNKFVVEVDPAGTPLRVLTGSTNWTVTGLCTQLNNVVILDRPKIAVRFRKQWDELVAAGDDMPPELVAANTVPTVDDDVTVYFAATTGEAEFKPVLDLIDSAKQGVLFLMFTPGQSPLLDAALDRARENKIYVRGVVSSVKEEGKKIVRVGSQVVKTGTEPANFHDDVLLPSGITKKNRPSWAEVEFSVGQMLKEHMIAIVHSKVILIDPFSDDCAVVSGSHNFSDSASRKNDENLVIIRGDRALAQAYAVHINGVYDSYSWRAFVNAGGPTDVIYKPLKGWQPGGGRHRELAFWMSEAMANANG